MSEVTRAILTKKRETKGAVLFENLNPNDGPALTNIYIRKQAFPDGVYPQEIVLIVEVPDD